MCGRRADAAGLPCVAAAWVQTAMWPLRTRRPRPLLCLTAPNPCPRTRTCPLPSNEDKSAAGRTPLEDGTLLPFSGHPARPRAQSMVAPDQAPAHARPDLRCYFVLGVCARVHMWTCVDHGPGGGPAAVTDHRDSLRLCSGSPSTSASPAFLLFGWELKTQGPKSAGCRINKPGFTAVLPSSTRWHQSSDPDPG